MNLIDLNKIIESLKEIESTSQLFRMKFLIVYQQL